MGVYSHGIPNPMAVIQHYRADGIGEVGREGDLQHSGANAPLAMQRLTQANCAASSSLPSVQLPTLLHSFSSFLSCRLYVLARGTGAEYGELRGLGLMRAGGRMRLYVFWNGFG